MRSTSRSPPSRETSRPMMAISSCCDRWTRGRTGKRRCASTPMIPIASSSSPLSTLRRTARCTPCGATCATILRRRDSTSTTPSPTTRVRRGGSSTSRSVSMSRRRGSPTSPPIRCAAFPVGASWGTTLAWRPPKTMSISSGRTPGLASSRVPTSRSGSPASAPSLLRHSFSTRPVATLGATWRSRASAFNPTPRSPSTSAGSPSRISAPMNEASFRPMSTCRSPAKVRAT